MQNIYYINSPLEQFEVRLFLGLHTPFIDLSGLNITTFTLYTFIVLMIISSFYLLTNNNNKIVGSRWLLSQEVIYDTILNMVKSQIKGKDWGYYFPFIYTLFMFIFVSNLLSMIPYSYALTAQFVFVISLSMIIWLGITILSFYRHGLVFFSLFVPAGTALPLVPLLLVIELLSYVARSVSLGLRLSANIFSGHLLMAILAGLTMTFIQINVFTLLLGFIPLAIILIIMCLEFGIAIIQAYVFSILASSYLKDGLYLH